jgi:hypothetical protein
VSPTPQAWLSDTATEWGGRPVARKVADARPRRRAVLSGTVRAVEAHHGAPVHGSAGGSSGGAAGGGGAASGGGAANGGGAASGAVALGGAALDAWLDDGSGTIVVRWLGREAVPGVAAGRRVRVEGTVGEAHGRLLILNPLYRFEPGAPGG